MYKIINYRNALTHIEITNDLDFNVTLSNYGASIYKIDAIDKYGAVETVTLSPRMVSYYKNPMYYGLTIGRVAGRIPNAIFNIDNKEYRIWPPNDRGNLLHSGSYTIAYRTFDYEIESKENKTIVTFSLHLKDMEDGYPGALDLRVVYEVDLVEKSILLNYYAISSKDTLLNITNHSYFNLSGNLKNTIEKHHLLMNKECVADLDNNLLIKGIIKAPKEFDFRKGMPIDKYLRSDLVLSKGSGGYDDIFTGNSPLHLELKDPSNGRELIIDSDYKDVVIFTNNFESETLFPNMDKDRPYNGIAIEPCRYTRILSDKGLVFKANALYKHYIKYTFKVNGE